MTTPRAYRRQAEATDDKCAALEAQLAEAQADIERLRFTGFVGGEMRTQEHALALDKMRADLEAARAQTAQMREALEFLDTEQGADRYISERGRMNEHFGKFLAALSSDAGRGYVSLEKHEAGLREAWTKGHDSVLAGLTTEDMKRRDADVARILKGGG